jgi:hypothetical protein
MAVGSAHPTGVTRLKLWVKRSLTILLIVFFRVLNAHNFSLVAPLLAEHPDLIAVARSTLSVDYCLL